MKLKILILFIALLSYGKPASAYEFYEAKGNMYSVARKLQAELPTLASDGLFQARHDTEGWENSWEYSFLIDIEKAEKTEVKIHLIYFNAYKTLVRTEVIHNAGGLLSKTSNQDMHLTKIWSERINKLLDAHVRHQRVLGINPNKALGTIQNKAYDKY